MTGTRFLEISDNHRRSIATTLCLLDEMLSELEQSASGREIHSVFYEEKNTLSARRSRKLLTEISRMRAIMGEIKGELALKSDVQSVTDKIWGRCSGFWEMLVEMQSKHLRAYGEVPTGLAEFLDPKAEQLIQHLRKISDEVRGGSADPARSAQN